MGWATERFLEGAWHASYTHISVFLHSIIIGQRERERERESPRALQSTVWLLSISSRYVCTCIIPLQILFFSGGGDYSNLGGGGGGASSGTILGLTPGSKIYVLVGGGGSKGVCPGEVVYAH